MWKKEYEIDLRINLDWPGERLNTGTNQQQHLYRILQDTDKIWKKKIYKCKKKFFLNEPIKKIYTHWMYILEIQHNLPTSLTIVSKLVNRSRGWPEGSVFSSYNTKVQRRMLLLSLDCSTNTWYVPYNAECLARRNQVLFFEFLVWLDLGLNPSLPDHWQTFYPLMLMSWSIIHIM